MLKKSLNNEEKKILISEIVLFYIDNMASMERKTIKKNGRIIYGLCKPVLQYTHGNTIEKAIFDFYDDIPYIINDNIDQIHAFIMSLIYNDATQKTHETTQEMIETTHETIETPQKNCNTCINSNNNAMSKACFNCYGDYLNHETDKKGA